MRVAVTRREERSTVGVRLPFIPTGTVVSLRSIHGSSSLSHITHYFPPVHSSTFTADIACVVRSCNGRKKVACFIPRIVRIRALFPCQYKKPYWIHSLMSKNGINL